jgi:tetratricopeptide (TPR) repeat protein
MKRFFYFFLVLLVTACGVTKKPLHEKQLSAADYPYLRTFHQGVRYKVMGQFKEAIVSFDSCFTVRPTDDAAAFALAQCYLHQNDLEKAAFYTEQAAKLDSKNTWYTQELAYMYFNQQKYPQAAKCFEKLVASDPRNIDWLFGQAEVLKRLNKQSEAIAALNKMENQLGVLPDLSIQKFELYLSLKEPGKAIAEIEKARKVHPDDLSLIGTLVDYYFQQHEISKAQEMLVELVKNDPTNARANLALGDLYLRQFKKKEAYRYLNAAFSGEGIDVDTKMNVLLMFYEQQAVIDPEVLELADLMVLKHPQDAKSHAIQGDLLLQNGKKKEALEAYQRALKLDDSKFPVWNQVLMLEYETHAFQQLYTDARACSALFPTMSQVQLLYTIACVQNARYQEAIDAANQGKELVVNDPLTEAEFFAQLGEAHFLTNQIDLGIGDYTKAIATDPSNYLTKNNFALRLALANKQLDKAESLIQEVLTVAPKTAAFLTTSGLVNYVKGNFNQALNLLNQAIAIDASDAASYDYLGDTYFQLGNLEYALVNWKMAKDLGTKNKNIDKKIQTKKYVAPLF